MNTPVSFEIAKLLKEKGFDVPCREGWINYLSSFIGEVKIPDKESNFVLDKLGNSHLIERPTIAEVIMWLYEKHGIWIEVYIDDDSSFGYLISKITKKERVDSPLKRQFNTPKQAYEAGINYVLKNLIK